jgi:cytochrome oxidase Cu insertion factor (SCO1/SenC/PrrC family)
MGKTQKILTAVLWGAVMVVVVGIVGMAMIARSSSTANHVGPSAPPEAPASQQKGLPELWDAPHFSLTDQNGQPVTDAQLRGKVWIAAFIFTHCAGPCPMMSEKMEELQKTIASPDVKLVSFTVDPERDTPEVLKQYAETFHADESRWIFLTGERQQIFDVAAQMKLTAKAATDDQPILHSTSFLLVDRAGKVRGAYTPVRINQDASETDEDAMTRLARDADMLASLRSHVKVAPP